MVDRIGDDLSNFNEKSFNKHVLVNLYAPAILTQDLKRYLKSQKGNIINIIDQRIKENNNQYTEQFITKNQLKVYKETIIQEIEKKTNFKLEVLSSDVNKRILNYIQDSINKLMRS